MYTLIRALPWRRILTEQVPALSLAWLVAELQYKFHSFSLECAAFLLTWFAFDALMQGIKSIVAPGSRRPQADAGVANQP